jgi:UDP-2-acetamido-2-deoxy-ribo-hexuluronate aminotransferase
LKVKLKYLNDYSQRRIDVASAYDSAFGDLEEVEIPARSVFSTHVFNQYTLKLKSNNRDDFKKYLAFYEIPSMIYYPVPLHLQKAFRRNNTAHGSFPVTEKLSKVVISLPIHTELSSEQIEFICHRVKLYFKK